MQTKTPTVVQVDHSAEAEYYVRLVYWDGSLSDDEFYTTRALAERAARRLAREHHCMWESNY